MSDRPRVEDYYNQVAEDYHRIYDSDEMSYKAGIQDYFRLQILLRRIAETQIASVYEVGVGDGTPLQHMYEKGLRVAGCDIAAKMVEQARARLANAGVTNPDIIQADIQRAETLEPQSDREFDALVAFGVMPHIEDDKAALDNMRRLLRTGGKLYIEFRNSLFSLFTFNRYTHDFITNELLDGVAGDVRERVSDEVKYRCRMDMPPVRDRIEGKDGPGYDLILAKYHNPLELPALLAASRFANPVFHWYHFHAAQPWLAGELGARFDEESIKLEQLTNNWRGMFLCSAVMVEADAA